MKKILVIPLDERPVNYDFPIMLARCTDYEVIIPPRSILGKKKVPGDVEAIWEWFIENIKTCDDAVISIDTLLFSGIVPSRLHYEKSEDLLSKLDRLRDLKKSYPKINMYVFSLIMRNPTYSSSEEEPDYYGSWGAEIHRRGVIEHKKELLIATDEEIAEYDDIVQRLPAEHLKDYLDRRAINIEVNKKVVELAAEGLFTLAMFPQDDASPYGVTAKDQRIIRDKYVSLTLSCLFICIPMLMRL